MAATQKLLRFGVFELNLDTQELRKAETVVKLAPQPLKLLSLLASQAGQVVSRNEIHKQLWDEDSEVDFEHVVNKCIKQIRTVLGDNADNPLYVETLPRHGYRFIAPVISKNIAAPRPQVVESDSDERLRVPLRVGSLAGISAQGAAAPSYPAMPTDAASPGPQVANLPELPRRVWRGRLGWAAVAAGVMGVVGGAIYWRAHTAHMLTERDTIVVADFDNRTGDGLFNETLKQALTIQLEQSPFLNVLSDVRVMGILKLMDRPASEPLTPEVAREVCLRSNSKAFVVGSIASVGKHYLLALKVENCQTGDTLASAESEADTRDQVLKALGNAGNQLRGKLGESMASLQKFNQPLEEATTPSLEALQALTRGRRAMLKSDDFGVAIPYYKLALELDPNFAYAYTSLGVAYTNSAQNDLAIEALRKAYELRGKVSGRERFYIEAQYYGATGELQKAVQTFAEWAQNYPGDYLPANNASVALRALGQWERAAAEAEQAHRLSPDAGQPYSNLMVPYLALNRLGEAKAAYDEAQARGLDGFVVRLARYLLAFLQGDEAGMQEQMAWAGGKLRAEDFMLSAHSDTEAYYGRFERAAETSQRAVALAQQSRAPEAAAKWRLEQALRDAEVGNPSQAREKATQALALNTGRDVRTIAALTLARAERPAAARKLAENLNREFALDELMQNYSLPTIWAAIDLAENNPHQAIEVLQTATSYELGGDTFFSLQPVYLRGIAYLQISEGRQAAAEFQKILDHPGIMGNFVTGALARLQLGRAQAMMGDKEAARQSYQGFLALWKDADPDIPIYKQAKAEYAKLQ